ncbi:pyrroline-5-carboxylate reductase [Limibacter armeniacum]|uniref:pyrroline-5-carboxylate reductase n=1 Tax=Limibacter armeniacum TaxID=466084 RepID=UPI002FE59E96
MNPNHITIIGGGNLGVAIAEGLIASKYIAPANLTITRRQIEKLDHLAAKGVITSDNNSKSCLRGNLIILAVKPYQIKEILEEIKPVLDPNKHVLASVVTGVTLEDMQSVIGSDVSVFRVMPNTAIAIRESMTCIATNNADQESQQSILELFKQLGDAIMIDEGLMSASTVLGACGIAYTMRFIRAAIQGGIEIGFSSEVSQQIAVQTVKGAASLLMETGNHPEQEIDRVTTPKGCTIAGLNEMEHQGFSSSLIKGIKISHGKISGIAEEFERK